VFLEKSYVQYVCKVSGDAKKVVHGAEDTIFVVTKLYRNVSSQEYNALMDVASRNTEVLKTFVSHSWILTTCIKNVLEHFESTFYYMS